MNQIKVSELQEVIDNLSIIVVIVTNALEYGIQKGQLTK
jgi:hypothetical protein